MSNNKLSSALIITASAIFIVGLVLGLTLGAQHAILELGGSILSPVVERHFNASVMFLVWCVSAFAGMILIALAEIIRILRRAYPAPEAVVVEPLVEAETTEIS